MNSEQTKENQGNSQIPNDWMPSSARVKRKSSEPLSEEQEAEFRKMFEEDLMGGNTLKPDASNDNENATAADTAVGNGDRCNTSESVQTKITESAMPAEPIEPPVSTLTSKRTTSKQRRESLEEYRHTFLTIPKLEDRKPVFISCEVRDRIDGIVRRLGGRGGSVSGFIENLARHHLDMYEEDIEAWRKL